MKHTSSLTQKLTRVLFFSWCSSSSTSIQTRIKRGLAPTLNSINQHLLFLNQSQKPTLLTDFFSQLTQNRIEPNQEAHSILAFALLNLNKFDEAEHIIKTRLRNSPSIALFLDALVQGLCFGEKKPKKALLVLKDCLGGNYGVVPSSSTFCSLINSFVSMGMVGDAIEVLELISGDMVRYPFSNVVCSSVISGFCRIGEPELGIGFFENALKVGDFKPNVVTYTTALSALFMLGRVDEAFNLVSRIEKEGIMLDIVFYSNLVCGHLRTGMLVEALRKDREMVKEGINPDVVSYTILIDGFSKEGYVEKAIGFIDIMIKEGLKPNLVTCTAIISGLCKNQKVDKAFEVFKMVEKSGIEMDEFIYAVLIDGFCKRGDWDSAYHLLDEMEKKNISPSIVTYNTLINGLCKFGKTHDAEEVSKGIEGDIITHNILLHGFAKEGNVPKIFEINRRFDKSGFGMDLNLSNSLIQALFVVGAFEQVYALFKGMQEMNLVANPVTYCKLIEGFFRVGRVYEAFEIFNEFRRTDISCVECYNCMIAGLCKNSMIDLATQVFIAANEEGLALNAGIHLTLVDTIFNKENAGGVLNLIHQIEGKGLIVHDILYSRCINVLCKRNLLMAAIEVCIVAKRNNLVVDKNSFYSLLEALLGHGDLAQSKALLGSFIKQCGVFEREVQRILLHYLCLQDVDNALLFLKRINKNETAVTFPVKAIILLIKSGKVLEAYKLITGGRNELLPVMDIVVYSIVIEGLCKGGHLIEALDLCAFAESIGLTLNILTYNSVIHGLCCQGCLVEAFRLFDSFERINLSPTTITYSILIDKLCKEGFLMEAKKLLERMVKKGVKVNTCIYNSFLNGYSKFGELDEALSTLNYMGRNCLDPDEFSVSAVIVAYCQKGDIEGALGFVSELKRKGKMPDFLGFLYLIRGLYSNGRMEEARSILREMLKSQSVIQLINLVDAEVETESIGNLLMFLCEQGSIKEAVTVLDEIGCVLYPTRKFDVQKTEVEDMSNYTGKISEFNSFGPYYSHISSLCLSGKLSEANTLAKELLSGFGGDC